PEGALGGGRYLLRSSAGERGLPRAGSAGRGCFLSDQRDKTGPPSAGGRTGTARHVRRVLAGVLALRDGRRGQAAPYDARAGAEPSRGRPRRLTCAAGRRGAAGG